MDAYLAQIWSGRSQLNNLKLNELSLPSLPPFSE